MVERYAGTNRTHVASIVGNSNPDYYKTVPVCYIAAHGSEPAKLLWATEAFGKLDRATIQELDLSFNVTGPTTRYDYGRNGQRIPVDYIYTGTGSTHQLIWKTVHLMIVCQKSTPP